MTSSRREFLVRTGQLGAGVVLGGGVLSQVACGSSGSSSSGAKFGLFTDTTGAIAALGQGHAQAFRLAIADINKKGGVLGKPLKSVLADSNSDPSAALPKVRQEIQVDHVDALVGGIFSSTREAVLPSITGRPNLIYIYPMTYEGSACQTNLFLTGAVSQQNLLPAVDYVLRKGARTWVLLGHDYVFPHVANKLAADMIKAAGGKVITQKYYPLTATDYSDAVRTVVGANPDAIINNITPPGMFTFYKQLGASGWHKPIVATGIDQTAVQAVGAGNLDTTVLSLDYVESADNGAFAQRFAAASGGKIPFSPGSGDGGAYRAVRFLAAAINKAGSTDTTKVRDALVGMSLSDLPGGAAAIGSDHHTAMTMYLASYTKAGSLKTVRSLGKVQPDQKCHF